MDIEGFDKTVKTLKLYHRINKNQFDFPGIEGGAVLEKTYVDLLPKEGVLSKLLYPNTTFLIGKRGTGKSTIIARAQQKIRADKDYLSVYVNAKTVYEMDRNNSSVEDINKNILSNAEIKQLRILQMFLSELLKSLKQELNEEKTTLFGKFKSKKREFEIEQISKRIDKLFEERASLNITRQFEQKINEKTVDTKERKSGVKATVASGVDVNYQGNHNVSDSLGMETNEVFLKYLDTNTLIKELNLIVDKCGRKGIFVFIDDYSELDSMERKLFTQYIIEPFYHIAKEFMHLKVAAYPDKLEYGNLEASKYDDINIDAYEIYGKKNISELETKAINYTKRLIENRLTIFSADKVWDYFDLNSFKNENELYKILFYCSICVPRDLGVLLSNCYLSNIIHDKKITRTTILDAADRIFSENIEPFYVKKLSSDDLDSIVKKELIVQQALIGTLIKHAQKNKKELVGRENSYFVGLDEIPTSHFRVNKEYEGTLQSLEFNNYIHKMGEIVGKGNASNLTSESEILYAFNYGLCRDKKIIYGKPNNKDNKYFQQRVFNYSIVIRELLNKNKNLTCTKGHTFSMDYYEQIKSFGMFCPTCLSDKQETNVCSENYSLDFELPEILNDIKWTNVEIDILSAIYSLKNDGDKKITANKIEGIIDISAISIGLRCKKLAEDGFISRGKKQAGGVYEYKLCDTSIEILEQSGIVGKVDNIVLKIS
ncbi:BREX system ATP-binding domain-containing protein [Listeria booriae]|uniref:BREX system ATP-binding domain-containing protein n=1 Tax=Listeria booriae TaxID=1552123 RepID=UPI0016293CA8|nr:BREX system ATP-binding domain-containing protein [Listeria booriae]MBC1802705.1 DUF2791 family P-loop domain-containing protein [Listeria booriae]